MTPQEQFAAEVLAFIEQHGIKPWVFGRDALGDPSFVPRLKAGRSPGLNTVERVRAFMANYAAKAAGQIVSRPTDSAGAALHVEVFHD